MDTASYLRKGQGESDNAINAKYNNKWPLTHAIKIIASELDVTQVLARKIIESFAPCEWHHSGKYARRVNFYNVSEIIEVISIEHRLSPDWRDTITTCLRSNHDAPNAIRAQELTKIIKSMAIMANTTGEKILDAYYCERTI